MISLYRGLYFLFSFFLCFQLAFSCLLSKVQKPVLTMEVVTKRMKGKYKEVCLQSTSLNNKSLIITFFLIPFCKSNQATIKFSITYSLFSVLICNAYIIELGRFSN